MNDQSAAPQTPSSAKKGVIVVLLAAAAVLLLLVFVFSARRPKTIRIIGVGDQAPEFTLTALDGSRVSLSSIRGKIAIVHFWATWCPPCVEEIPSLDRLYRSAPDGIAILAVGVDQNGAAALGPFIRKNNLALPVLLDTDHAVASLYGTFKYPETYIIDRNGTVRYKVIGSMDDWTAPGTVKALQELARSR